uniref:Uncharacterized protein n=1 Tax=Anguilla anguilla TaxID=7936 RepID=A0A0E9UW74_ANGAN
MGQRWVAALPSGAELR